MPTALWIVAVWLLLQPVAIPIGRALKTRSRAYPAAEMGKERAPERRSA